MAKYRYKGKGKVLDKVKGFFTSKWLLGAVGAVFAVAVGLNLFKKFFSAAGKKSFDSTAQKVAYQVAEKMGTIYPKWDPRAWVEDDDGIVELIQEHADDYDKIASEYYKYTESSLSQDIVKFVDDYHEIAHLV